jgi:hypothetical protein
MPRLSTQATINHALQCAKAMATVQELLAKGQTGKAIDLLKYEHDKRPHDERLGLQLADLMVKAGREKDAIPVLFSMAERLAADGFSGKAIAIFKRVQKLDPSRRDVEERLAQVVEQKVRAAPTPPSGSLPTHPHAGFQLGLEEFDPDQELPEPDLPVAGPVVDTPPLGAPSQAVPDDPFAEAAVEAAYEPLLATPLFDGLERADLIALMKGLNLLTFAAGDILVAEGAAGNSLFILTSGVVKAWVKDPKGNYFMVKELHEGAFFGEISVLTGKPRTATITAATGVEVLELDRKTLDELTQAHPRIKETLREFHENRAQDTVKKLIKSGRL